MTAYLATLHGVMLAVALTRIVAGTTSLSTILTHA
jgi:hypothetical protein